MNNFSGGIGPRPKRIAIDFHNPADTGGGDFAMPSGVDPNAGQTAGQTMHPPIQVANPSPGSTPAPLDRYVGMAQGLLGPQPGGGQGGVNLGFNPASLGTQGGRAGPADMSALVRFSATPEGKAAIQGAIDNVIQQRKSGMTAQTNPYQYIIATLKQSMGYPVTA